MRIKKIRAKNMVEALRKVKDELGEEAVILDSGKIKENGLELYEVVAAVEEHEIENSIISETSSYSERGLSIYEDLRKDILEIKGALRELLQSNSKGLAVKLLKEGVPEEIVEKLEKSSQDLPQFVLSALKSKGVNPLSRLQVFVGEPGVGKTTSLFKLAFWYRVHKNSKVAILSVDNYKIGGKEQSQKLSNLLEIPFYQSDWEDFQKFQREFFSQYDFLLIDTPSLSKRFTIHDLYDLFKLYPFLRFYWVVRVTENAENMLKLWEDLKDLPVDGIILTFLDRLYSGYRLFWLLKEEIPAPLFGTTGERIPEDLEILEGKTLLGLFLRGIKDKVLE
ncbi:hypothetical protein THC_0356 [Caldimicrobium thiodismutans]|uniref:SRP54-type proteins GTP-binding domain-containing protein n=1 Tax=Caldimicrobium thiodismutans TaxID=1653476 RepID=A0A0U5ALN2_9BACT|nr:hypothetical protein [Caldimicrobium thiodismutans]BAU22754.1 hypothetical protein THC_0356 [Caldimicrobium thiodismutans]